MTTSEFLNAHKPADLTWYRIAKLTGLADSGIQRYFKGVNEPSLENFFKLCFVLNVPAQAISDYYLANFERLKKIENSL